MTEWTASGGDPDPRVGTALATLATDAVPDHDPQFWQTLGRQLIAERDRPAAPTLDPVERLGQADRQSDLPATTIGPSSRRGRKSTAKSTGKSKRKGGQSAPDATTSDPVRPTVTQLAERADWVRHERPDWRRRAVVVTSIAAVATVLVTAVWLGATAERDAPPPTAGRLATVMSRRVTTSRFILGRVDTVGLGTQNGSYAFVRSAGGSLRYRALDRHSDSAYDVQFATAQDWHVRPDGTTEATSQTGLAPGPPDADGARRYLEDDELGTIIRTLNASPSKAARAAVRRGREVWILDIPLQTSPDAPIDQLQVVVDQRSRLPVEVSRSVKGAVVERKRFSEMRTASNVRQNSFQLTFPGAANPLRSDNGFRLTRLPDAAALIGYPPVTPDWLPPGYELSTVAVLPGSPLGLPSTAGGDNPANRDVVSLVYRYRASQLTVTVRRVTNSSDHWKDPFLADRNEASRVQRLRLDGGRFLGTTVELTTVQGAPPHIWGRTTDYVFTVSGDVQPSQVLRVANSLN